MKPIANDHRAMLLLIGALVAVAGIAWGAAARPHATPVRSIATAKPAARVAPSTPAIRQISTSLVASSTTTDRAVVAAPATISKTTVGAAGMRIFRDPQTGEIGPPTPETLSSGPIQQNDVAGLTPVRMANGGLKVDLQGRFMESMMVQLDANGKPVVGCVHDDPSALARVPAQAPLPAPAQAPVPQPEEK